MKTKLVLLGVAVVVLVAAGAFAYRAQPHTEAAASTASTTTAWFSYNQTQQVAYWAGRIRAEGATAAWKEFSAEVPETASNHEKAHAFGGALYEVDGLSGITTCDFHYQYGCFHEFIGRAVVDKGLSVISQIDAVCLKSAGPSGCQHGIGHGLMFYYNYTLDGLKKALVGCDTYTHPYPFEGCYSGVFMEFNTEIMLGDDGQMRQLEHNDYNYPCAELDQKYQAICAYHQTSWWNNLLTLSGDANDFTKLGKLCRGLDLGDTARMACFAGLGVVAGDDVNYNQNFSTAAACDSAGSTAAERLACRSLAAGFVYSTTNFGVQRALLSCQGLSGDALSYCESYTADKSAFVHPTPLPKEYGVTF